MADIFISYKSEERALPEALASDLRAAGYSVWWDVDLVGGAAFRAQILEKLNAARAVIVIWTPASVQSEFVLDEADHAKREGKLIPVRVPELDPRDIPLGHRSGANLSLERASAHPGRVAGDGPIHAAGRGAGARACRDHGRRAAVAGGERGKIAGRLLYYLRKFRDGAHAAEADDLIWGILSAENTVASYRRYLTRRSKGRHRVAAEFHIERLRKAERAPELAQYEDAAQRLVRTLSGHTRIVNIGGLFPGRPHAGERER